MKKIVKTVRPASRDALSAIKMARAMLEMEDPNILKSSHIYRISVTADNFQGNLEDAVEYTVEFRLRDW